MWTVSVFNAFRDNKEINNSTCRMVIGAKEKQKARYKGR